MAHSLARLLAAVGCCAAFAPALQPPAHGADATFTSITTPAARTTVLVTGASRPITVAGRASSDVSLVDVDCVAGSGSDATAVTLASSVPVAAGAFSVTASVPSNPAFALCRLRALPSGVLTTDPLASYAGPVLDLDTLKLTSDGTNTLDFRLTAGSGSAEVSLASAGRCGDASIGSVPADLAARFAAVGCVADLGGSMGSLRVDGHPALLPPQVLAYTNGTSRLALSVHARPDGRLTWVESATLYRCALTDSYPPSSPGQCGSLLSSGVQLSRRGTLGRGGHVITLRDRFRSADGKAHRVSAWYGVESTPPSTGALGFDFPGSAGGFVGATPGEVVTGLPSRAATVLIRSDRYAAEGDPLAGTRAITWSRRPTRVRFATSDATVFGLHYSLVVPAGGAARLGLADSFATLTSGARTLARSAAAAMMPAPRITSPARGAVIPGRRTVVRGVVRAGANGLPVSVSVNGHAARLVPRGSDRATYRVVIDEPPGTHRLTATAADAGHNTRSTSITVRNTP